MRDRILFLTDDPNRAAIAYNRWPSSKRDNTIWTSTVKDAIFILKDYGCYLAEAHLDHDLGGETYVNSEREDSGMEFVRYLESISKEEKKAYEDTLFICHSHNLRAGMKMVLRLKAIGLQAKHIPFGELEVHYD
jgi:hypothetical protein